MDKKISAFAGGANQRLHVIQIAFQGFAPRGSQPVFGLGQTPVERFRAQDVVGFFELSGMDAEISVGGFQQRFKFVKGQRAIYGERADDAQADSLMNQPIQGDRDRLRRGATNRRRTFFALRAFLPDWGRLGHEFLSFENLPAQPPYRSAIQTPKAICTAPNPAAINRLPQEAGAKSAAAPRAIRHIPMMGTARTENAPPVTMAVP